MSRRSRLTSMRSRILDFEKDVEDGIQTLLIFDDEILKTGLQRSQWLANVSHSLGAGLGKTQMKIETLDALSKLLSTRLTTEIATIDCFLETQSVQYLIAVTKPYQADETEETRKIMQDLTCQKNIDDVKDSLNRSTAARLNLTSNIDDLIKNVIKLKYHQELQSATLVAEMRRKIAQYAAQLRESSAIAKANHRQVTADYLVLRHNSRVATEILVRSQNEASLARGALQEDLYQISMAAASQRDKVEQSSEAELQSLTDGIRSQLLKHERELETLQSSKNERIKTRKSKIRQLRMSCDIFNEKYDALQAQRKNGLERVGRELKRLREMVSAVEARLNKLSVTEDLADFDKYFDSNGNRLLEKNSRAMLENLEHRLKLL